MKKNKLRRGKSSIYNAETGKNTEDHLIQHFYSFDETNHGPDKWNGPSHGVMDRLYTISQDYNFPKSAVSSATLGFSLPLL